MSEPLFQNEIEEIAYKHVSKIPMDFILRSLSMSSRDSGYALDDIPWYAFFDYVRNVYNLKDQTERYVGLIELSKSADWWIPHKSACFLSDRRTKLHLERVNDQNQVHNENGPVFEYIDGFQMFAFRSVVVPAFMIMRPECITKEMIFKEVNQELRTIMMIRVGPERLLKILEGQLINSDLFGELWETEIKGDRWRFIKVVNGSPEPDGTYKNYILTVPPDTETCREGVAWTTGINNPKEIKYVELGRT